MNAFIRLVSAATLDREANGVACGGDRGEACSRLRHTPALAMTQPFDLRQRFTPQRRAESSTDG